MRTEIFNSPSLNLIVFSEKDDSLHWTGTYKGILIKDAVVVDGECIILLDPDASKQPAFKNLLRVGRDGNPRWLAELPTSPDAFIDMRLAGNNLVARSWSGYEVCIDLNSGKPLVREFVK